MTKTLLAVALAAAALVHAHTCPVPDLVRYEDGSAVLYVGDQEVGTFPAGTMNMETSR